MSNSNIFNDGTNVAIGSGAAASNGSVALGSSTASGPNSFAIGNGSTATGSFATAIGVNATASGTGSFAIGANSIVSNQFSIALGVSDTSSGQGSYTMGNKVRASGNFSTAMGNNASTNGMAGAFIIGDNPTGTQVLSTASNQYTARFRGGYVWYSDVDLSTQYTMAFDSGRLGIGTSSPAASLDVEGNFKLVDGTQQNGFVLTTDSFGNASWKSAAANVWNVNGNNISNSNGGNVGVGTATPNSTLQVNGSVSIPYAVINTPGGYTLTAGDHTIRRFGNVNNIIFPDASTCIGRVYTIISSNRTGSNVGISPVLGQTVYDDVTNTTITFLTPNQRITVQSDGANWIVIGN